MGADPAHCHGCARNHRAHVTDSKGWSRARRCSTSRAHVLVVGGGAGSMWTGGIQHTACVMRPGRSVTPVSTFLLGRVGRTRSLVSCKCIVGETCRAVASQAMHRWSAEL